MVINDNDIKVLKDMLDRFSTSHDIVLDVKAVKALLARLHAAEAVLDNGVALTHSEDCDKIEHRDLDCTCGSEQRWEVWRRAAGKDK